MAFNATRLMRSLGSVTYPFSLSLLLAIGCISNAKGQDRPFWRPDAFAAYDLPMYERPTLTKDTAYEIHLDGLQELWLRALDRPDAQLQRLVVDTIAIANHRGVPGLKETADRLVRLLTEEEPRNDVRRAIAQTLIELDAKDHAETLAELSIRDGESVAVLVEPALARWKSEALKETWLKRVQSATAGTTSLTMAIEGLAALKAEEAADAVQAMVTNPGQPTRLRTIAARNLGQLRGNGITELAESVLQQTAKHPGLSELLAIELLSSDASEPAIALLSQLVDDERTVVQSRALNRLLQIDFKLVDRYSENLVSSSDSSVRLVIAKAMLESKRAERIGLLANLLDDVVPSLRQLVATGLIEVGKDASLQDEVTKQAMRILNQDSWRGCEQACVVLTELDHEPSGSRMVELLRHPRSEVKVVSAWGLARLRVPEHLPDMLDHAKDIYAKFQSNQLSLGSRDAIEQIAHLFIAFGDQNHQPAEPLVKAYVPRNDSLGDESRTAACWAIGMLHAGDPDPEILGLLAARIRDVGIPPERLETRWMSAVSIGRMKGESELPTLRMFSEGSSSVNRACQWAINQITGETVPGPERIPVLVDSYFLMPIQKK